MCCEPGQGDACCDEEDVDEVVDLTCQVRLLRKGRGTEEGDKTEHGKLEEVCVVRHMLLASDVAPRRQGCVLYGRQWEVDCTGVFVHSMVLGPLQRADASSARPPR